MKEESLNRLNRKRQELQRDVNDIARKLSAQGMAPVPGADTKILLQTIIELLIEKKITSQIELDIKFLEKLKALFTRDLIAAKPSPAERNLLVVK